MNKNERILSLNTLWVLSVSVKYIAIFALVGQCVPIVFSALKYRKCFRTCP